jgi:hypothetical protein
VNSTSPRQWLGFAALAIGLAAATVVVLAFVLVRSSCAC